MTREKGGRYACEEDEGQGEAKGRQAAGRAALTSRLRSENGATQEDREKEEVAAAAAAV
jgi:hypothetical protein